MVREPGKPRGKMTAYAFFVQTCREEHKRTNPGEQVVFSEFSKKCAGRWKVMDTSDKRPFEEMAARDKMRWEEEMKHWTPVDGRKGKKQKRKKDPNAPKRPQTAFFLFCADHREALRQQFPELRIGDIAKKLGEKWSLCDTDKKKGYEVTANEQKEEYKNKMEAYKSGRPIGGEEVPQQQQAQQQIQQQTHQQTQHQQPPPPQQQQHQQIQYQQQPGPSGATYQHHQQQPQHQQQLQQHQNHQPVHQYAEDSEDESE